MGMFKPGDHVRSLDPSTTPALEAIVGKVFADRFFTAESYPKGSMVKPGFHYHSPEYWKLVEAAPPSPRIEVGTVYRTKGTDDESNLRYGVWALDDPNEGAVHQFRTSVPLVDFDPKGPKEAPCCDCKTVLPREKLQASPHGSLFCAYCSQRIRLECAHNIDESNGECILCGAGPKWTQAPDDEAPWEGGLSFASRTTPEKPGPNEGACAWASSDWESDW